ncbi:uncharacterized protein LOC144767397 [Lissotriton helveticus]
MMEGNNGLSFTGSDIDEILAAQPLLQNSDLSEAIAQTDDWDTLSNKKREQIRTAIHGIIMTEYLRFKTAPRGLWISNAPRFFLHDLAFCRDWSSISWKCTLDYLVLIVKTAKRLSEALLAEIQTCEQELKRNINPLIYKKRLDEITKELEENQEFLMQNKLQKLAKDVKKFSQERMHPYSKEDYTVAETGSDADSTGGSSNGSEGSYEQQTTRRGSYNPRYRGPRRGNRNNRGNRGNRWQKPPFFQGNPMPFFQQYMPPFGGWMNPYNSNMDQHPQMGNQMMPMPMASTSHQTQQSFLGQGQNQPRGKKKNLTWQDHLPNVQTRSMASVQSETNKKTL